LENLTVSPHPVVKPNQIHSSLILAPSGLFGLKQCPSQVDIRHENKSTRIYIWHWSNFVSSRKSDRATQNILHCLAMNIKMRN